MIVDASVLVKLFCEEDLSEEARRIVGEADEIWSPAHALAEVAEILSRKGGTKRDAAHVEQAMLARAKGTRFERVARPLRR
jgi:predicted nucleic acid-binding protein